MVVEVYHIVEVEVTIAQKVIIQAKAVEAMVFPARYFFAQINQRRGEHLAAGIKYVYLARFFPNVALAVFVEGDA